MDTFAEAGTSAVAPTTSTNDSSLPPRPATLLPVVPVAPRARDDTVDSGVRAGRLTGVEDVSAGLGLVPSVEDQAPAPGLAEGDASLEDGVLATPSRLRRGRAMDGTRAAERGDERRGVRCCGEPPLLTEREMRTTGLDGAGCWTEVAAGPESACFCGCW